MKRSSSSAPTNQFAAGKQPENCRPKRPMVVRNTTFFSLLLAQSTKKIREIVQQKPSQRISPGCVVLIWSFWRIWSTIRSSCHTSWRSMAEAESGFRIHGGYQLSKRKKSTTTLRNISTCPCSSQPDAEKKTKALVETTPVVFCFFSKLRKNRIFNVISNSSPFEKPSTFC